MILRDLYRRVRARRAAFVVRQSRSGWEVLAGDPLIRHATGTTHLNAVRMWLAREHAIHTRPGGIRAGEVWGDPRRAA